MSNIINIDFGKMGGLVPAIIQDADTRDVLMLGFMNREAYDKTQREGRVSFFSRSRDRIWTKGEESGHFLDVVEIRPDCDNDTLLILARPRGPVCHTGEETCFGAKDKAELDFLGMLETLLEQRKADLPEGSYSARLFRNGADKIAKKLGEEAVELVIEAKNGNDERLLDEAADLMYHLLVLLVDRGYGLKDVSRVLESRH